MRAVYLGQDANSDKERLSKMETHLTVMVIPDQSNQSNSLSVSTFGGSILVALNWCGYPQGTKVLNKGATLMNIHKFIDMNEVIASNHPLAKGTTDSATQVIVSH